MADDSSDPLLNAVGHCIRKRREAIGLTQEGFAARAGFQKQYANRVERGLQNLNLKSLHRIATALETSISELLADLESVISEVAGKP